MSNPNPPPLVARAPLPAGDPAPAEAGLPRRLGVDVAGFGGSAGDAEASASTSTSLSAIGTETVTVAECRRRRWLRGALLALLALYAWFLGLHTVVVAGGSDSSGYLNSGRLLSEGRLLADLRVPAGFPALTRTETTFFCPQGFFPDQQNPLQLTPTYPTGLPLHFAAAGLVLGWTVGPWLVVLGSAVAAVWLCYLLARELGLSRLLALTGAAMLAVFPVFLFASIQPLSDTPATAWTLLSLLAALRAGRREGWAAAAGAALAMAVLVRPTNLLLAPALLVLLAGRARRKSTDAALIGGRCSVGAARTTAAATERRPPETRLFRLPLGLHRPNSDGGSGVTPQGEGSHDRALRSRDEPAPTRSQSLSPERETPGLGLLWRRLALFVAGGLPGAAWLAFYNHALYGHPLRSGYGPIFESFGWEFGAPTALHFAKWLALMLPTALLVLPFAALTRPELRRRALLALTLSFAAVTGCYLYYRVSHEVWWCLRFILPVVPCLILGGLLGVEALARQWNAASTSTLAAAASPPAGTRRRDFRPVAAAVLLLWALGASRYWIHEFSVFMVQEYEQAYAEGIDLARRTLPPGALVLSQSFSGTVYYYADAPILRWDQLKPEQFQRYIGLAGRTGTPLCAVLFKSEEEDAFRRCPGSWTKLAEIRNVGIWQLQVPASAPALL